MQYFVNKVRKESARGSGGTLHEHIVGVVTLANIFYSNQEVVSSIGLSNEWFTSVLGQPDARIKPLGFCPGAACYHQPYLTTAPDHSTRNNLENLPPG